MDKSGWAGSLETQNREMAPECVILAPNSCVWMPVWSEAHSPSYVTSEDG